MNLVQIAASTEYGAYYYDPSTSKIYHVPYGDLLELNNVHITSLIGGLLGGIVVAVGMIKYAKELRYGDRPASLLFLLAVWVLSSCMLWWLVKSNQRRLGRLIRERYHVRDENLDLSQIVKRGRKAYIQVSLYCVFLFSFAVVSLSMSVTSASVLYALFSIVFFDTGVMMITIL